MRPPHKQTTQGVVIKNNILDYDEEMSKQMLFCFFVRRCVMPNKAVEHQELGKNVPIEVVGYEENSACEPI